MLGATPTAPLLKCCVNGRRPADLAPATPEQLAASWRAAYAAGADAVHVHPRGRDGRESLTPTDVAAAILALRAAVPEVPVGVTTGAWILPGVEDRLRAIADWVVLPDFASVNVREQGSFEVAALLAERGIVVEAGVWDRPDAERIAAALPPGTGWLLLEPMDPEAEAALDTTAEIAEALAGVHLPRILHGLDAAAWAVLDESVRRGWGTRIGLEDTLLLADGTAAGSNAALVSAAVARGAGRASSAGGPPSAQRP